MMINKNDVVLETTLTWMGEVQLSEWIKSKVLWTTLFEMESRRHTYFPSWYVLQRKFYNFYYMR